MNTLALSPRLSTASDSLKLSDGRSVRWFVEALQLFRRFDETSSKDVLRDARKLLQQCVDNYPQDLLPSFYLAIADSVLGDMNQDAAIATFERFSQSDKFEVRAAAEYNLAAAYVEAYDVGRFPAAIKLLDTLLADLNKQGAPVGVPGWFKSIRDQFSSRRTRVEQLYYQALETRAYLRIHLDIWKPRWQTPAPADFETQAQAALNELAAREATIRKHQLFLGDQGPEIWGWHWNNIGMIEEARAAHARRSGDEAKVSEFADQAEAAYKRALSEDPGFSSARANLGRLYLEVTQELDKAAEVFLEALKGAEDTDYSHYGLGLVRTLQDQRDEAVDAFRNAPVMLERKGHVATWSGARKMLVKALCEWGRDDEALRLLRELARDHPDDDDTRRHIAELEANSRNR
jgi:tetratricopeptide (TPR) repeat protein